METQEERAASARAGAMLGGAAVLTAGLATLAFALRFGPAERAATVRLVALGLVTIGTATLAAGLGAALARVARRADSLAELGTHRVVLSSTLLVILVSNVLAAVLLLVLPVGRQLQFESFLVGALTPSLVILLFFAVALRGSAVLDPDDLGLRRVELARDLVLGLAGGLLLIVVAVPIQLVLRALGVEQTQAALFAWVRDRPLWQLLVVLAVVGGLAPVAEEAFFRGFVFRAYLARYGPKVAYPLSALLFAALHLNLPAFPALLVLGWLLAWLYRSSGSIIVAIVAHGVNNTLGLLGLYFGGLACAGC
jgi:membrane protease YdiL (CAAX protease family)